MFGLFKKRKKKVVESSKGYSYSPSFSPDSSNYNPYDTPFFTSYDTPTYDSTPTFSGGGGDFGGGGSSGSWDSSSSYDSGSSSSSSD
jgi:uncharacterized membrane protein YgcG